ncbi:hypothetical protein LRP31_25380 [Mesorhizobium mediterraneum]|uniref:Uncharacterized protein n=1 Tax=Mesorhizobium mediterraneum TaxID=43617 RepID=A0AB36R7L7_9HYPH|nr:hypothetical protein [Mesorhizobium mediterraneum]PAQ00892.1 hypothetical protein CIT25_17650 [Mesorhizobium mediterraneum]WIW52354.1 hypothetical protein LRP31_25380 [Mesorhizobium mediterraneum]
MNETKHTPGPWQITRYKGRPHAIVAADPDIGAMPIAKVHIANDHEANANLIAAAPDMLAILKEAADFVQPFNRASDFLDRIEAVIARAEQRDGV